MEEEKDTWYQVTVIILLLLILGCLASCKTVYRDVPTVHDNYIIQRDTFIKEDKAYIHDSVYIFQTGDTVYKYKEHTVDKLVDVIRNVHDTINKVDSVPYYIRITKEKELTASEERYLKVGKNVCNALMIVLVVAGIALFGYIVFRLKKIVR